MTSSLLSWPPLPLPITTQARQRSQPDADDPYLYRRNLATAAIMSYLKMIAVPHRLDTSANGLNLYVEELQGYLACCPVSPEAKKCEILAHERANCKGFLFVELSEPYHQAHILGFVRDVTVSELPLSYLQPLSAFTAALDEAPAASQTSDPAIALPSWVASRLPGWLSTQDPSFSGVLFQQNASPRRQPQWSMRGANPQNNNPLYERYASEQGDVTLVNRLCEMMPAAALAAIVEHSESDLIRWQAVEQLAAVNATHPLLSCFRAKSLADELAGLAVALLVGVISKSDGTFLIGCRLCATGEPLSLPVDIVLKGIDDSVDETIVASAAASDAQLFCELTPTVHGDPLEYLFTAERGDRFSFQVHHQGHVSTSSFLLPGAPSPSETVP